MKRLLLFLSVLMIPCLSGAFPKAIGGVYSVRGVEDLKGGCVRLQKGSVLRISGQIRNGTVVGNGTALEIDGKGPVLDRVLLDGEWDGAITDGAFVYRSEDDHYPIVASMMHFNRVEFSRKAYWLKTWETIQVNRTSMDVYGNGVTLYLPEEKGPVDLTVWGPHYNKASLFATTLKAGGNLHYAFHDMRIIDNARVIGKPGWGHDTDKFRLYSYFGVMGRDILFDHIETDGGGAMAKMYNIAQPIDTVVFRHCSAKTVQFAVEVMNVRQDVDYACRSISFENCRFTQYRCQCYVGLLSVVGDIPTDSLVMSDCVFDAREKDGNLELTSCKRIVMQGCTLHNTFIQSEHNNRIERYDCCGNSFHFHRHYGIRAYEFSGKKVIFKDNTLYYHTDEIGFITSHGGVEELYIENNTVDLSDVPRRTSSPVLMSLENLPVRSSARIYMDGNRVIPSSAPGSKRFQVYMPRVLYREDPGLSGLSSAGFERKMSAVPMRGTTLRNYDEFKEQVFTVSVKGRLLTSGRQEIWSFQSGRVSYALGLEGNVWVLRRGGKVIHREKAVSGCLDVTFSRYGGTGLQVLFSVDGTCLSSVRTEFHDKTDISFVYIKNGDSYRIASAGLNRGGILQE